jgi:predicted protein tyrosine phosphatase
MIDWTVRQTICGLDELDALGGAGVTHLLSILDPDHPEPASFNAAPPQRRLTLRFHDVILPLPGMVMPTRNDLAALLDFGRDLPEHDPAHLVIHCHMGISRSTAAMVAVVAQAHPGADEDEVVEQIESVRAKAWPNSLMIRHADIMLGRQGRLVAAVGRLYRRQLERHPHFAEPLRQGGRIAEVEMAEAADT